jgi:PqqD family protein of HPr-rel-A system
MIGSVREGCPVRKPKVWLRQAEGENVVYDPSTGTAHLMNATAVAIWALCDGATKTTEMIDAVCLLSGLPREVVGEDVERILDEFHDAGILSWGEYPWRS